MTASLSAARLVVGAALVQTTTAAMPVFGQNRLELRPSVSGAQVYESNLFATRSDRQEDFITRVTPALEAEYRSPVWTFTSDYSVDAERFSRHSELTAGVARQHAAVDVGYQATPRLTLASSAEYLETRTPGELNVGTALAFVRARGRRFLSRTSITRQATPLATGTVEYTFNSDRLGTGYEAEGHLASLALNRRLSPRTAVTARYQVEHVEFTHTTMRSAVASQALTAGVSRSLTPGVSIAVAAGPRVTGDVLRPQLAASIDWRGEPFAASLAYGHTQTTAIGLIGAVDSRTLHAAVSRTFGRSRVLRIAPAVFRSALGTFRADVYVLGIGLTQRLANGVAAEVAFDGARQRGTLLAESSDAIIPRHTIVVRLVADPTHRERWSPK